MSGVNPCACGPLYLLFMPTKQALLCMPCAVDTLLLQHRHTVRQATSECAGGRRAPKQLKAAHHSFSQLPGLIPAIPVRHNQSSPALSAMWQVDPFARCPLMSMQPDVLPCWHSWVLPHCQRHSTPRLMQGCRALSCIAPCACYRRNRAQILPSCMRSWHADDQLCIRC